MAHAGHCTRAGLTLIKWMWRLPSEADCKASFEDSGLDDLSKVSACSTEREPLERSLPCLGQHHTQM